MEAQRFTLRRKNFLHSRRLDHIFTPPFKPNGSIHSYKGDGTLNKNNAKIITTIAGNGIEGYSGDGDSATDAALFNPHGVAVDAVGNIYISDWVNNRIRKVNTSGIITTMAGNGTEGYSGDGGPATEAALNRPACVDDDAAGNLSNDSLPLDVTTPSMPDTLAPSAPADLAAPAVGDTTLTLTWSASNDNVGVSGDLFANVAGGGIDFI